MPRRPIIRSNLHYYHVVARVNNKEAFYIPIEEVWEIMMRKLASLQKEHELKIGAFVLMKNHFHLLMMTPKEDIDRIMYFLMRNLTSTIQKRAGRINKIFGGRYKGCLIENERYLLNVYKYIYRNPVAAGICEKAEDYFFSTLFHQFGGKTLPIDVDDILEERKLKLDWINNSFSENEVNSIRFGLSRTIFDYKRDRATNRIITPTLN